MAYFINIFVLLFLFAFIPLKSNEKSYSHVDGQGRSLDLRLIEILNFKRGVFIEVGAHNGIFQSNTKLLEECYGWTGILIEPSQNIFELLKQNRSTAQCFNCALGSFEEDNTYVYGDFNGNPMSCVNGTRVNQKGNDKVLIRSLQSILDEVGYTHINFFSLDTEGYELNILKGIDFTRTTFDYFLIEIYQPEYDEIISLLDSKGYKLIENFTNYDMRNRIPEQNHNDYLFCPKVQ